MNYTELWERTYRRARHAGYTQDNAGVIAAKIMAGRMRSRHAQRERWLREACKAIQLHF